METEIQNKHRKKKSLEKEIRQKCIVLKSTLGIVVFNTLLHHLNKAIKRKQIAVLLRHHKELEKFRFRQNKPTSDKQNNFQSCIVHNFSSYSLSQTKINALSFGLDKNIPTNINRNSIQTEFESFYQRLVNDMPNILENELQQVKTKLRNTCERYCNIKVPYQQRQIIKSLSQRDITIMKADKVRGVVIMNKSKYLEKCLTLLNSEQFIRLNEDPIKTNERKVQRLLRKIKPNLTDQEYKRLYPSGSAPGKFYSTAKLHKISINDGVDKLTIRPITSNIGTPTYQLGKYLAKLLSPLADWKYTVTSTKDFIEKIKNVKVPDGQQLISFDVKSLFTNVPLQKTIDLILKCIDENKEINPSISKKDMKDMLVLCTKNVHFSMNGGIYLQIDGVAMGCPLGSVLAGIFMVELERSLVPKLNNYINFGSGLLMTLSHLQKLKLLITF